MSKPKLVFYCVDCGNEVLIDKQDYSGGYDVICKDCEEQLEVIYE